MRPLPLLRVAHPHVELIPDGSPYIAGTRIPVRRLWQWHRKGVLVETLVKRYPTLGWAKVLDALSFAYDNEELIEWDLWRERTTLGFDANKVPGTMDQVKLPFPEDT